MKLISIFFQIYTWREKGEKGKKREEEVENIFKFFKKLKKCVYDSQF